MKTESGLGGIHHLLRRFKWSSNLTAAHVEASEPVLDARYRLRLLRVAANTKQRLSVEEIQRRAELFNRARNPRIKLEIIETGATWIKSRRDLEWWEVWALRADRADAKADRTREKERADHRGVAGPGPKRPLKTP